MIFCANRLTKAYDMKYLIIPFLMLVANVLLPAFQSDQWDLIGAKNAKYTCDTDKLIINAAEGPYEKLKVYVHDAPLHIYNLRITYHDGTVQDEDMCMVYAVGGRTHHIDLSGKHIDHIEFVYPDAQRSQTEKGRLEVYATK